MEYMNIGKTSIKASTISLGAWAIGGGTWWKTTDDRESIKTVQKALDLGLNLIDTAPVYGFGHSEEILGKSIKENRHNVIISSKCGLWWDTEQGSSHFEKDGHIVKVNVSKQAIKLDLEKSLKRLNTDYIDIYYTHQQAKLPFLTPIEETVDALMALKKEGKIRAIGACNIAPHHIADYLKQGELDIVQQKYSLLDRAAEEEILPLCKLHQITFHAYSPLEQGLLTGKIKKDFIFDQDDARNNKRWWSPTQLPYAIDFVESLADICKKYNCTPTHLAIAWIRAQGSNINVICGARKIEQIEENIEGITLKLEPSDILEIRNRVIEIDKKIKQ
jgi:methylglyoxal reductase